MHHCIRKWWIYVNILCPFFYYGHFPRHMLAPVLLNVTSWNKHLSEPRRGNMEPYLIPRSISPQSNQPREHTPQSSFNMATIIIWPFKYPCMQIICIRTWSCVNSVCIFFYYGHFLKLMVAPLLLNLSFLYEEAIRTWRVIGSWLWPRDLFLHSLASQENTFLRDPVILLSPQSFLQSQYG